MYQVSIYRMKKKNIKKLGCTMTKLQCSLNIRPHKLSTDIKMFWVHWVYDWTLCSRCHEFFFEYHFFCVTEYLYAECQLELRYSQWGAEWKLYILRPYSFDSLIYTVTSFVQFHHQEITMHIYTFHLYIYR